MPAGMRSRSGIQNSGLSLVLPGSPPYSLTHTKGLTFRIPQFSDLVFEFTMERGQVKALKEKDPSGEFSYPKR